MVRPVARGFPWTGPRGILQTGRGQYWGYPHPDRTRTGLGDTPPHRTRTGRGGGVPTPAPPGQDQTLHLLFRGQHVSCGCAGGLSCNIMEIANGAVCQYFRWGARELLAKFWLFYDMSMANHMTCSLIEPVCEATSRLHFYLTLQGIRYLLEHDLVADNPMEIAKFFHGARNINWESRRMFLDGR